MKNKFEQNIKSSLESYQAGFNPADWADMNTRLDSAFGKPAKISRTGKNILIAASVIAVAGLIYYFSASSNKMKDAAKTAVENPVIVKQQPAENVNQPVEEKNSSSTQKENNSAAVNASDKNSLVQDQSAEKRTAPQGKVEAPAENKQTPVQENNPNEKPALPSVISQQADAGSVLKAGFHADINKVCEGIPVQFSADENKIPCTYKWLFGDGETSVEQNPKHVFKSSGTFSVKLRLTSLADKKSDEQKNNITVAGAPSTDITYRPDEDNKLAFRFDAGADKTTELKWDFGDRKTASGQNPEHTFAQFGTYKVILTAKNNSGCITTVSKEVKVENKLFAPNSFTPNGDNVNDTWMPSFDDNCTFTLTVFDGSSNVVYSTSDRNSPWDGMNPKTGSVVKEGDLFTWKAVVKESNGELSTHSGKIVISK